MDYAFPNTGSQIDRSSDQGQTTSGLSTQIIIKVDGVAVGAIQSLKVNQNRPLKALSEVGTDGIIEIVPNGATTFKLDADRIVFDNLRLPEAFKRGFRFINSQRLPFDIDIYDIGNTAPAANVEESGDGVVVMTFKNCWFGSMSTSYNSGDYTITESAGIEAETGYISSGSPESLRSIEAQTDSAGIEGAVNNGQRRGSLDVSGLLNSIFS